MSQSKWTPGLAGRELEKRLVEHYRRYGDISQTSIVIPLGLAERLVAESNPATPEMAEALRAALEVVGDSTSYQANLAYELIVNALAKVEGRD
jgi:hypothetical protein